MALRLPVGELQPILTRLAEKVIDGLAMGLSNRSILQKETAAIEVKRDSFGEVIQLGIAMLKNIAIDFVDPTVQPIERVQRRIDGQIYDGVTQTPEDGRY